jgi:hypothetical protein
MSEYNLVILLPGAMITFRILTKSDPAFNAAENTLFG